MPGSLKVQGHDIGNDKPLFLIAGPCVIESEKLAMSVAETAATIAAKRKVPYVFKASFDKANRTSVNARRGPGMAEGLRVLAKVRREIGVPVLTDVHEYTPVDEVAEIVDVLQTPAFLVRQTDFMQRVAKAGRTMNIKKGQFLAPGDMTHVVEKCKAVGNDDIWVCERGTSFGYGNLISDMRAFPIMRKTGCPVVFDATHSVQEPGGLPGATGGQRNMVPPLARAAVAVGVAGVFMETHPDPDNAWSDGPNQWRLDRLDDLLAVLVDLDAVAKSRPYLENEG
jgi:2-dehydro-3-deoxyphosphooctonate aldolase (KDO 8-P synthase)